MHTIVKASPCALAQSFPTGSDASRAAPHRDTLIKAVANTDGPGSQ